MLTRAELSRAVTSELDVPLREGEAIVEVIIAAMVRALHRGERIEIRGFGGFFIHRRGPRVGRNPKTGVLIDVPAKKVVHFRPGKEVARLLNSTALENEGP